MKRFDIAALSVDFGKTVKEEEGDQQVRLISQLKVAALSAIGDEGTDIFYNFGTGVRDIQ